MGGITSLTPQPRRLRSAGSVGSEDRWSQARSNHAPSPTICKSSAHDGQRTIVWGHHFYRFVCHQASSIA
ncbi:hypothetical protein PGTUg99_019025 [Puccinia graminis f. sp. tritici]|uniref:Uncharacterized protein n=1 Tax=Puccinia graminis f. sp. tritici TaxID=56615 RepID=A0A5B0NGF7_PUCGR|nr:hypothetical protein PGTUg99_019025 [Puccinia graminis f. sp. tritici]